MPKIDGIKYPDTFADAIKDKVLGKLIMRQTKQDGHDVLVHLIKVKSNFDPKSYYETFLMPGARMSLKGKILDLPKAAHFLAETGNWNPKHWKKIHAELKRFAVAILDSGVFEIYRMKEFQDYHAKVTKATDKQAKKDVKQAKKEIKISDAMMKRLGVSDKKGMTEMLAALHTDNEREAEKIMEKVLKKEANKEKPKDFITRFRKLVKI